jgi:hypothetical protein
LSAKNPHLVETQRCLVNTINVSGIQTTRLVLPYLLPLPVPAVQLSTVNALTRSVIVLFHERRTDVAIRTAVMTKRAAVASLLQANVRRASTIRAIRVTRVTQARRATRVIRAARAI